MEHAFGIDMMKDIRAQIDHIEKEIEGETVNNQRSKTEMGNYRKYGMKLDTLARRRFADYEKASDELKRAEQAKRNHPMPASKFASPEYFIQAKEAEVAYEIADMNFKKAKDALQDTMREAQAIRAEMLEEVKRDLSAKPDDLDRNVVDLINSGICSPTELTDLYGNANITTRRYIAKHAKDLIDTDPKIDGSRRQQLSILVANSRQYTNPESYVPMQNFDTVINGVLSRCVRNPSMISKWGELTEGVLSEL